MGKRDVEIRFKIKHINKLKNMRCVTLQLLQWYMFLIWLTLEIKLNNIKKTLNKMTIINLESKYYNSPDLSLKDLVILQVFSQISFTRRRHAWFFLQLSCNNENHASVGLSINRKTTVVNTIFNLKVLLLILLSLYYHC